MKPLRIAVLVTLALAAAGCAASVPPPEAPVKPAVTPPPSAVPAVKSFWI